MIRPSLIFLGFIVGIAVGLVYGWLISPVKYTDTSPDSLRADYKEQYLVLVAAAYKAEGDLDHARVRLSKLKDASVLQSITALAQQLAAQSRPEGSDLALLAADLNDNGLSPTPTSAIAQVTLPPDTSTPAPTPIPTNVVQPTALVPTLTPSPQADFDYTLVTREPYCNDDQRQQLIIVDVVDSNNAPLPGVRLIVRWPDGEDGFVTGLKPEISSSYGDFKMSPGVTYSVQIGTRTPVVTGLTAPLCTSSKDSTQYAGAMRLVFQRQ